MDLRFSEEDEAWRKEVTDFMESELPEDWLLKSRTTLTSDTVEGKDFRKQFVKKLSDKGWIVGAWPKEHGGQEWPLNKQLIFNEVMGRFRTPRPDMLGIMLVASPIMLYGTPEQKAKYLPSIAKGETVWCQGFSEPNAGSDLASLSTRAEEQEDCFVINGQKTWTTHAHAADGIIMLAKTDPTVPKRQGISCFLVDMKTPGITVVPIIDASGYHSLNEVYFDNVKAPKDCLLGPKNQAWSTTMRSILNFERSMVGNVVNLEYFLNELIGYVRTAKQGDEPLAKDPLIRQKVAQMVVDVEVARMFSYRNYWKQSQGIMDVMGPAQTKLFVSELQQKLADTGMDILKLPGLIGQGPDVAPMMGMFPKFYVTSIPITFGAGTSEIQKRTMAMMGLGLPKEPKSVK